MKIEIFISLAHLIIKGRINFRGCFWDVMHFTGTTKTLFTMATEEYLTDEPMQDVDLDEMGDDDILGDDDDTGGIENDADKDDE